MRQKMFILLCMYFVAQCQQHTFAQGWIAPSATTLVGYNSTLGLFPLNVGIGLSSPNYPLQINSSTPDNQLGICGSDPSIRITEAQTWTGSSDQVRMGIATNNNAFVGGSLIGDFVIQNLSASNGLGPSGSATNGNIIFGTSQTIYNGLERMRITQEGNVGINVTNPLALLNTNGSLKFDGLTSTASPVNVLVQDASGYVYQAPYSAGGGNAWLLGGNTNVCNIPNDNFLGTLIPCNLNIGAGAGGPNTFMTVVGSGANLGNVGVHLTSPNYPLQIDDANPDLHLGITGTAPSIRFSDNQVWGSSVDLGRIGLATRPQNDFSYLSLPGDFVVQALSSTGNLIFATNTLTCGSLGDGVEQMRIDPNGWVGVNINSQVTWPCGGTANIPKDRFEVYLNPDPANPLSQEDVRIDNLPAGSGNIVVYDPKSGRLYYSESISKSKPHKVGNSSDGNDNSLQDQISELKSEIQLLKDQLKVVNTSSTSSAGYYLEQNTPNPFSGSTTIKYGINEDFSSASIRINDLTGRIINEYAINTKGDGNIVFETPQSGMYIYSLVINNEIVSSNKMQCLKD